jgi:signal transduction histidine kinase
MKDNNLPSLEQLIRAKIQRRIIAAMALLFAGAVIITIVEAALSYSDLVTRLDKRADVLQDLIISEVLVNNEEATNHILADANRETPDQSVKWLTPTDRESQLIASGITWHFPGTWTFVRPLKQLGDQNFGTFIFSGNFFTSGGLVSTLTHRLIFAVAICFLIAILLLPIARKAPRDLILGPVQHLMALIKDDSSKQLATSPAFAEIESIQNDFVLLMNDRRKLESQRLETAQLRTVTRTAQMLAHDIRRPFSLLKATLDGLTQTNTPEAMQELVRETVPGVKKSLEHLDGIIAELTTMDSTTPTEKVVFPLSEAIHRGVAIASPRAAESKRVVIQLNSGAKILGVQNQIERVIANIVSNALQVIGPTDRIEIESSNNDNTVVSMKITNTGSHIPPNDLENIFQPFFTKGKPDGTGLGLAICRQIVVDHGGSIGVKSNQTIGTRFTVKFPIFNQTSLN